MSEICRLAGIHRTTFYGHYEDIYDLMAKMIADFYVKMMDNFLTVDEIDGATCENNADDETDGATPGDNADDEGTARTEERESGLRLGNGFSQLFTLVRENKTLLLAYMAECEKKGIAFDVVPDLLDEHIIVRIYFGIGSEGGNSLMNTLLRSECIQCLTEQQFRSLPEDASEEQKLEFLQRMYGIFSGASREVCAPVIVREINELSREIFGCVRDYSEEKSYYNQLLLKKEQGIREKIHGAEDPLLKALQFSLVGNYIDFSAVNNVEEEYLETLLKEAEQNSVTGETYERLKRDLSSRRNLLFLTDNAGEGVLDKLYLFYIPLQVRNVLQKLSGSQIYGDSAEELRVK
ncbi:MAG: ARMT1-like domain-containing protein [Lachnospiraceae bacterium]|nr:ARMT1-like domain-containing protein [Lachnospiraceae bacterium]